MQDFVDFIHFGVCYVAYSYTQDFVLDEILIIMVESIKPNYKINFCNTEGNRSVYCVLTIFCYFE